MRGPEPTAPDRPGSWAALSLERKLPALICGFLLAATLALSLAGYLAVRKNALDAGAERVAAVSSQYHDYFAQQSEGLRAYATAAAAHPDVRSHVLTSSSASRSRAAAALRYTGPGAEQHLGTNLRAMDEALLVVGVPGHAASVLEAYERSELRAGVTAPRVGEFRLLRDSLVYPVIAPVDPSGSAAVFIWRRLPLSERTRLQISRLVGADAAVLLGNQDDSVWTDLERVLGEHLRYADVADVARPHVRGGERYLARSRPVAGTGWMIVAELPFDALMAPVNDYLRRMGLIALLVIGVGLWGAWRVSRDITRPLADLTAAASAIAQGDFRSVPTVGRVDELGHLSGAMQRMAAEVEHARSALEAKVDERTRALHAAMSELHETQDALVRREKLATLGQLASGVGHELRNPLGVMTNAVFYLRAVLATQPENVREYLDILQQQISLSEKIVADLLDFARSKPPHRVPVDLRRVVQAQVAQLGANGHAGVAVREEFPPGLPPVLADGTQVGQIVQNLLSNALQAMTNDGTLTIRALGDVDRVHLEVMDTGTGVPPDHLERIFEPLFTTKARGIGLGLALSRTLARANEGDLAARNNAGGGATFTLTLPLATEGA